MPSGGCEGGSGSGRQWFVPFLLVVVGLSSGCGSTSRFAGLGAEGDYLRGQELYEKGRCFQAVETLERFLSEHPGSARVDDAIYYLGLSRKCMGEYLLAREEFDRLLREFPQSENREAAEWEKALSFFESRFSPDRDPEPTQLALDAFDAYLRHYPQGEHASEAAEKRSICLDELSVKAYENGRTYERLKRYAAAVIYYEKALTILGESSVTAKALAGLVRCRTKAGEEAEAEEAYRRLLEFATPERREADPSLEEILRDVEEQISPSREK